MTPPTRFRPPPSLIRTTRSPAPSLRGRRPWQSPGTHRKIEHPTRRFPRFARNDSGYRFLALLSFLWHFSNPIGEGMPSPYKNDHPNPGGHSHVQIFTIRNRPGSASFLPHPSTRHGLYRTGNTQPFRRIPSA